MVIPTFRDFAYKGSLLLQSDVPSEIFDSQKKSIIMYIPAAEFSVQLFSLSHRKCTGCTSFNTD